MSMLLQVKGLDHVSTPTDRIPHFVGIENVGDAKAGIFFHTRTVLG